MSCPHCGTPFAADQVNLALGVGACGACGQVHALSGDVPARVPADPDGLEVTEGAIPTVSWAWRGWVLVFLVAWCLVWDGVLVVMTVGMIASGELATLVFLAFQAIVGIGVTWLTIATALNRTTVALDGGQLVVRHGPVPWFGNRSVVRSAVRRVWVKEDRGSKGSITWSVHADLAPADTVRLVHGLASEGRARFLETWLVRGIGPADAPVPGDPG